MSIKNDPNSVWNRRATRDAATGQLYTRLALKPLSTLRKALKGGADPNEPGMRLSPRPILMAAGVSGSLQQLEALLNAGANPECMDIEGRSPLHLAVQDGSVAKTEALLKVGVVLDAVTPKRLEYTDEDGVFKFETPEPGLTPSMMAARQGHAELLELLRQYGASMDGVLHAAAVGDMEAAWRDDTRLLPAYPRETMVPRLLEAGMDPDEVCFATFRAYRLPNSNTSEQWGLGVGGGGETPLHLCAQADGGQAYGLTTIEALIAYDADIGRTNVSGKTPLHEARSDAICVRFLKAGADLEATDKDNRTPLGIATELRPKIASIIQSHMLTRATPGARCQDSEASLNETESRPVRGYGQSHAALPRPKKPRL